MKNIKYLKIWSDVDTCHKERCVCNDNPDVLYVDYDNNQVICALCGHKESNWLIKSLIDLYAPIIDDDCIEQIKSFYDDEVFERENAEVNKGIECLKTARI